MPSRLEGFFFFVFLTHRPADMEGREDDSDDEGYDSHDQEEWRPSDIDAVFWLDSRNLVNAFDGHIDDDRSDSAVEGKSPPLTDIDGEDEADGDIGD